MFEKLLQQLRTVSRIYFFLFYKISNKGRSVFYRVLEQILLHHIVYNVLHDEFILHNVCTMYNVHCTYSPNTDKLPKINR